MAQSKELLKNGRKKPKQPPKKKMAAPYPFDEWFDALNMKPNEVVLLTKGQDFPCRTNSMAVQLRGAAANYGIKISISIDDENHVIIRKRQAFGAKS
jgi:hypothetical protein